MTSNPVSMVRVGFKTDVFSAGLRASINRMRNAHEFFDVKIVCNGSKIECHKVLLAAASPYFSNILADLPKCAYPVVVMTESKSEHVRWLVDLVYGNEIRVNNHECMEFFEFLKKLGCSGVYCVKESDLNLGLGLGVGGGQQIRPTSTAQHDDGGMGNMQGQSGTPRLGNRYGYNGGGVVGAFNAHLAPKRSLSLMGTEGRNIPVAHASSSGARSGGTTEILPTDLVLRNAHNNPNPNAPQPSTSRIASMPNAHGSTKIRRN